MKINISNMMDNIINSLITLFLVLSLTISFAVGQTSHVGGIILFVLLGIIMLLYLFSNKGKIPIEFSNINIYMIGLIFTLFTTSLVANNVNIALHRTIDIVKIFFMMFVFLCCFKKLNNVNPILKIIMWSNYLVVFYFIYMYGLGDILHTIILKSRVSNDLINANTLGLCAAQSIILTIYYMIYEKKYLLVGLTIPSLMVMVASGSKKAFILLLGSIVLMYILKSNKKKEIQRKKIIITLALLFLATLVISTLPIFDGIVDRFEKLFLALSSSGYGDSSSLERINLIKIGWKLFLDNPIVGVGINNPQLYTYPIYGIKGYYLHNNYIEILAGSGILGFVAYYWIYVFLIKRYIKYMDLTDKYFIIAFVFMIMFLLLDMGQVTYERKFTYFYLIFFYKTIELMIKKEGSENSEFNKKNKKILGE